MTLYFFFFKQKTAYEMRISDWSSDVCSGHNGLLSLKPEMKAAQTMAARTAAFCINPGLQKQIKYKGIFICCRTTDPMIDASRHSQRSPGGSSRARLHRDAMDTQRRLGRNNLGQCK